MKTSFLKVAFYSNILAFLANLCRKICSNFVKLERTVLTVLGVLRPYLFFRMQIK